MALPVRPCAHCGHTVFHVMPNMQIDVAFATTVFGVTASQHVRGRHWTFNLVVCQACGCSQMFTGNANDLLGWVPGAGTTQTQPR